MIASRCLGRVLLAVCVVAFVGEGCSTMATVVMRDGARFEGQIAGGDASTLTLRLPDSNATRSLERSDILDIDHPGNGQAAGGLVLTGLGLGALALYLSTKEDSSNDLVLIPLIDAGVFLALGVPMAVWGFSTWRASKAAAEPPAQF